MSEPAQTYELPQRDQITEQFFNQKNITTNIEQIVFHGITINSTVAALLTGAPDNSYIEMDIQANDTLTIAVRHEWLVDDKRMQVLVVSDDQGLFVEIADVYLKDKFQKQGLLTRIFAISACAAQSIGASEIILCAAGGMDNDKPLAGIQVWPKLGFNAELSFSKKEKKKLPAHLAPLKTVIEFRQSEEGQAWWNENKEQGIKTMYFDLSPNSKSWRLLDHLLQKDLKKLNIGAKEHYFIKDKNSRS